MKTLSVALAGNPNSGKTTLFNMLTGSHQHVGNWPGKTVEKRSGRFSAHDTDFEVVDLPGTYSLAAVSPAESIARDNLLAGRPDVVVLVVDAANPERNLYLTVQILEMGIPSVVALNMTDTAESRGIAFDCELLESRLGVPVIRTVARRRQGIDELVRSVIDRAAERVE